MHRSRLLTGAALHLVVALTFALVAARSPQPTPVAVDRAAETTGERGLPLLPAGTVLDGARADGNILELYLTLPPDVSASWNISPLDIEALYACFAGPFIQDPEFGGLRLFVRRSAADPYGALESFQLPQPAAVVSPPPAEVPEPLPPAPPVPRGGYTNAARQPTGALSGVTVFVSGGHGWTAGDTAWYLQRPVLLDMNEDYGNLDQLNYFVHFAFNAGATVVPFRPVGWQPNEVVLDNDDPGVTYSGAWNPGDSSKYYENGVTNSGIIYQWTSASTSETATARYTPNLPLAGFYPVYAFTIASGNRTRQTYRVAHTGGISEITVDHRLVGNGWVFLGEYWFDAGTEGYVEITNLSDTAGAVIADAIRWGCGLGDVSRPGPNSVSGYPRDEEGQRYWAHSELGNNAVGFDPGIFDLDGYTDGSDNVGTAARWAREMNVEPNDLQLDRWKRVQLEFHTNALNGTARGQLCLVHSINPTTNQTQFATILADEVDADLLLVDDEFEFLWYDRQSSTLAGEYGAISALNNGNEFDATLIEVAFHDNDTDAKLMRDDRVRAAVARACVHGITRFLHTLPGSQVPLSFAPDTPRRLAAEDLGDGNILLSWQAPLSDGARGDPATGYVVYQSDNGYGFGDPIILGDVLSTTLTGVPVGQTRYFRVAATNAGGESMPSEVVAVRRPATGLAEVIVVNGYDRLRRQINPLLTFAQPPPYAGQTIERQIWRHTNSADYVVQHAEALAASGYSFVSCSNEAVVDGSVLLGDYGLCVWICGLESSEDITLTATEQNRLTTFLNNGGGLFISGADLAYDLVSVGHGITFAQDTLMFGYGGNDAGTYQVTPATGSILEGLGAFDFSPASGAAYDCREPDTLTLRPGAAPCLNYVGGSGGIAAVQYTGTLYNAVSFGFPFEAISSPAIRAAVMQAVMEYLESATGPLPFDYDHDGDVDWADYLIFVFCFKGPGFLYNPGHLCLNEDNNGDRDVDLNDFAVLQQYFGTTAQ